MWLQPSPLDVDIAGEHRAGPVSMELKGRSQPSELNRIPTNLGVSCIPLLPCYGTLPVPLSSDHISDSSTPRDAKDCTCCITALSIQKDKLRHNCNMHVFGLWNEAGVPGWNPMQTQGKHANSTLKGSGQICIHDLLAVIPQCKPFYRCGAQIYIGFFESLMQLLLFGWDCLSSQCVVGENNDP